MGIGQGVVAEMAVPRGKEVDYIRQYQTVDDVVKTNREGFKPWKRN